MFLSRFLSLLFLFAALGVLQGCTPSDTIVTTNAIDPAANLSRADYLALRQRHPEAVETESEKTKAKEPPIPLMPDLLTERAEKDSQKDSGIRPTSNGFLTKKISVSVTEAVPVRDVLIELVRKVGGNLELDPRVQGGVILSAKNQPFGEVLDRICDMAGLRATMEKGFIHIEPDTPYQKTYQLDYLSLARKTTSETSLATNVFDVDVGSGGGGGGMQGGRGGQTATENNSTAKVTSLSDADFWQETEKSVAQILSSSDAKGVTGGEKGNFSLDRQAGMVTVYGTERQQRAMAAYFENLRRKAYAQVLIDARIIEVELNDAYQSGIDWTGIASKAFTGAANFGLQPKLGTNGFFTASVSGTNFNGLLNLVQTFGTTRVLSAPRVTVLNNQTAVMKVATNQVYFVTQAQFTTTTNANGSSVTTNPIYTSTPRTVPVGLVMTVQPAIDSKNALVTMTLRPTISRVVGEVNDPSINLNAAIAGVTTPIQSQIPVLAVREMDSVIRLHSGEIAVMGGLMQDSSMNTDQGVPIVGDLPYVGNLFKSRNNQGTTSELVILLRATIVDKPSPDGADTALYRNYSSDPRPLTGAETDHSPSQDGDSP